MQAEEKEKKRVVMSKKDNISLSVSCMPFIGFLSLNNALGNIY